MSCYFHMLRKRKAAEAVKLAEAVMREEPKIKPEAPQKGIKARKKGDAR